MRYIKFLLSGMCFSGCLAIHPGSVILTLDLSSIEEDDRAKLTEVGVFVCDQGNGIDCSQAANYDKLEGLPAGRGLKEKETIGLSLRDFVGPLHLRLVAAEKNTAFDTPNEGLIAQAEAFVDVESARNIVMPVTLLASPNAVSNIDINQDREITDITPIACGEGDPFRVIWSEFDGATTSVLLQADLDLNGDVGNDQTILTLNNNFIREVKQAGDIDCDNLGVSLISFDGTNDVIFGASQAPGSPLKNYQATPQGAINLNMAFGAEGFTLTWEEANPNGNIAQNLAFQQKTDLDELDAIGGPTQVRNAGGAGIGGKISSAGGATGVTLFVDEDNQTLVLSDLLGNRQNVIAQVPTGHFPFDPQIAFLDEARILAVWFDCEADDCSILGRIVDRASQDAANQFPTPEGGVRDLCEEDGCFLIAESQSDPFDLSLGVGVDGSFVVAWRNQKNSGNENGFELQVSFYGPDGPRLNPFSGAADIAAVSPIGAQDNLSQENIQSAVTPSGDLIISWNDTQNTSDPATRLGIFSKAVVLPAGLPNLNAAEK